MNVRPEDIDIIETGGMLDGQEVKLIRTTGGYWMGACKGKLLTGGSHPAIVKFAISKMYPNFQPALCKSQEYGADAIVEQHSHFLSNDLRKDGYDIYSIQENETVDFKVTKNYMEVASVSSLLKNEVLCVKKLNIPMEFVEGLSGATTEKALSCKAKSIKVYG